MLYRGNQGPKNIAIMYENSDTSLKQELCKCLKPMQRNGQVAIIESAEQGNIPYLDIILVLLSPAFLADDLLVSAARYAFYHKTAGQRILPIIVRSVDLKNDLPELGGLREMPFNGKPVKGQNLDRVLAEITGEIRKFVVGS